MFHIKVSVGYSSRRVQGASIGKEQALKKPDYAKITIFIDNATDLTPEGKIKGADPSGLAPESYSI